MATVAHWQSVCWRWLSLTWHAENPGSDPADGSFGPFTQRPKKITPNFEASVELKNQPKNQKYYYSPDKTRNPPQGAKTGQKIVTLLVFESTFDRAGTNWGVWVH